MIYFDNISAELREWPNFVCWLLSDKTPINAETGAFADVTNILDLTKYDVAEHVVKTHPDKFGIGFALTERDPFGFVDCDGPARTPEIFAAQRKIVDAFNTCTEISPSGNGVHSIFKAPGLKIGKRNNDRQVELYTHSRYMTLTGNLLPGTTNEIRDCSDLVVTLSEELGGGWTTGTPADISQLAGPQLAEDEAVLASARQSANGAKFVDLYEGRWEQWFPNIAAAGQGPSEADFALIDMLQFHTSNPEQIERLFRGSALGQRDKVVKRKDYVSNMIKRSFDRTPPPIDAKVRQHLIEAATQSATAAHAGLRGGATADGTNVNHREGGHGTLAPVSYVNGHVNQAMPDSEINPYPFPPGLWGELANYYLANSPRPVPEIASAAALATLAGITGRSYHSPTGIAPNLYIVIVAETGTGKDAAKKGIDGLINKVAKFNSLPTAVPAIKQFRGPAEFGSGQALYKQFNRSPCFLSVISEFGLLLTDMLSPGAPSPMRTLHRQLTALYNGADRDGVLDEMVYSEKDKNTLVVERPSLSLLGETTPETFYGILDGSSVERGFAPRLTTFPYTGPRVHLNANRVEPSQELLLKLQGLAASCLKVMHSSEPIKVVFDEQANAAQHAYDIMLTHRINASGKDQIARHLWNRGHMKCVKIAMNYAIGLNMTHPVITLDAWEYARWIVDADISSVISKFATGEAGTLVESTQANNLKQFFRDWHNGSWADVKADCAVKEGPLYKQFQNDTGFTVVPHSYLSRRAERHAAFKKSRNRHALRELLDTFVKSGTLREYKFARSFTTLQNTRPFSSDGTIYVVMDETMFVT